MDDCGTKFPETYYPVKDLCFRHMMTLEPDFNNLMNV